jgi:inhibitor of KinA sporulation pathway (predicted exonuclease)
MNIISLDLELNQAESGPKIIEVGAAIYKAKTGELVDIFKTFVDPNEPITERITALTGIKNSDVKNAPFVTDVYLTLKEFHKKNRCFKNPIVWGSGTRNDSGILHEESRVPDDNFMGFRVIDAKTLYQSIQIFNNKKVKGGLKKACDVTGIGWDEKFGPEHRALADAHNTFRIWHFLTKKFNCKF